MRALHVAVAAAVVAAAGCGGPSGRAIFAKDCASCHSLTGHEGAAPAGDLAVARLRVDQIASFARTMPVRPPLTRAQAQAVARYVHAATQDLAKR